MIVITGTGRSGTSFLAELYRNLGFDPGGGWQDTIRAGREQRDVVKINNAFMDEINVPRAGTAEIGEQHWEETTKTPAEYADTMREVSKRWEVVKDPRFAWSLKHWLDAGTQIDHVVVTLRATGDVVKSAVHSGMAKPRSDRTLDAMASNVMLQIGCLLMALGEREVPHTVLYFPDYMDDHRALHAKLPLPRPVKYSKFEKALKKTFEPKLVNFGRNEP